MHESVTPTVTPVVTLCVAFFCLYGHHTESPMVALVSAPLVSHNEALNVALNVALKVILNVTHSVTLIVTLLSFHFCVYSHHTAPLMDALVVHLWFH